MTTMQTVTLHLRNGEQRTYKGITRVDTSRPHIVRMYSHDALIAQIAKEDVVKITPQNAA